MNEIELDARTPSTTGMEPPMAAGLAYLAGPFSGVVILMAERSNRFVRFHAWQAIAALGALGFLAITLLLSAYLGLFLSPNLFTTLNVLAVVAGSAWLVVWALCLINAWRGLAMKLPLVGNYAERKALR